MLLAAILCLATQISAADLPEPSDDFYVLDEAGILSNDTKDYIIAQNKLLFDATGAQIVVVTENFVPDGKLESYAYNLFNKWEIGSKDENNGVLLLISIGDDDYWCTQGKGLEKSLSSGTIGNILEEYLEPDFAKQSYDAGIKKVFTALLEKVGNIYGYAPATGNDGTQISPDYIDSAHGFWDQSNSGGQSDSYYNDTQSRVSSGTMMVIIVIIIIIILRSIGSRNSGCLGCLLGWTLFGSDHNRRPPPPGGFGGHGGFGGRPGGYGRPGGGFGGHSGSGRSGGFGGSRGSSGRSSGFGGGSRGGGGSTRGGGAGRRH